MNLRWRSEHSFRFTLRLEYRRSEHFNGRQLSIQLLDVGAYWPANRSRALPILTGEVLTEFLARLPREVEFETVLAFDEWLQAQ